MSFRQILEEHDRQIKKNACKKAYLGSFFIPEKYVISALCESMDEPDTPSCNSSGPRGFYPYFHTVN